MPVATSDTRSAAVAPAAPTSAARLVSIDVVRGVVMVLMAIDHVRVYSGLPAGGPTAGIFFTRWITHFCAPAFVFFAGTGAFLHGRTRTRADLSRYLLVRGAWLVLLELTVIRLAWTFNFDYADYLLAGVIWMLGICMILMAGLVRFSTRTVAIFGLMVIFLQQIVALPALAMSAALRRSIGWIWQFLYFGGGIRVGPHGPQIAVLYSIVPWIGVMAAGYAFGAILIRDSAARRRACFRIGLSATALFLVAGGLAIYLQPAPDDARPVLFRLLGQQKYPASQAFLLMTLGPTIAVLPLAEKAKGALSNMLAVFGRVPLFYYLLHIPTIHAAAIVVSLVRTGRVDPWLFGNHPMAPPPVPDGYTWSLPLLYLVFATVIALLYVPCRWYARTKAGRPHSWMQYV
jgi:uncharacterized membrane protein